MKKIEYLKRTIFVISGISLILLFTFCENEDDNNNDIETDTNEIVETVKKSREDLIVNRDTMTIANIDSITDFENKHTPEINIGEKDEKGYAKVLVTVGSNGIVHPSEENHWIDFMTLYIDGKEYKHIEIENGEGSTKQEFFVPLENAKEVKVILGCNIHGIWMNTKILD